MTESTEQRADVPKLEPIEWTKQECRRWPNLASEQIATLTRELAEARTQLEAERVKNARLSAPVSELEWADALTLAPCIYITHAERATQIIKDRAAEPVAARASAQPQEDGHAE
jgi:hypothetical protein